MCKSPVLFFLILILALLSHVYSAKAQTIIRDSEIESYMSEWFAPIFQANGMSPSQVKIIIVQDNNINAFVAGGSNIFIYTGLIEKTENPLELVGVIAHELGHISGGHLVRGREAMEQASYESILGTIIGVGAAVVSGQGGAIGAGSIAGNSMAQRRFLSKARIFESSADQAAITSMNNAGLNPSGLLSFMKKLENEELMPTDQQSEYILSHPLTQNRINTIEAAVKKSPNNKATIPTLWIEQHARMQAKLMGYIHPEKVDWAYDTKDKSIPALYARTVADYRTDKIDLALKGINNLINQEPQNPYFYELKGQMLIEFGRVKESLPPYQKAVNLRPNDGLLRIALAHAQIESAPENSSTLNQAIENLNIGLQSEPKASQARRLLATAYGRQGNDAMARLNLAEEAVLQNNLPYAKQQAEIALKSLPKNSSAALRANDILLLASQKK